jgi:hypothetical protein
LSGSGQLSGRFLAAAWVPALTRKRTFVTPAAPEPEHPRRVLSHGEAIWDQGMNAGQLERLRRARSRDLLVV